MTLAVIGAGYVEANWGRWIVRCPRPWCASAMQVWPGDRWTACKDCEAPIPDLVWPADPEAVEALLMARPAVESRNWLPGESLKDLLVDNVRHGLMPPPGDSLMLTVGDRVVAGTVGQLIRSDIRRHQIEAATVAEGH
jgi:hypothetical protein